LSIDTLVLTVTQEAVKAKLVQCSPQLRDGINSFVNRLLPLVDDAAVEALVSRQEQMSSSSLHESDKDAKSCISLLLVIEMIIKKLPYIILKPSTAYIIERNE